MHETVLIVFIVIGIPVICVTLIIMSRQWMKNDSKRKDSVKDQEAQIIDDIYWGLKDLNKRIENIETIYKNNDTEGRTR